MRSSLGRAGDDRRRGGLTDLDDLSLAEVEASLERACGLALSSGVRPALADAVRRASSELGLADQPFLARLLDGDRQALAALVEHAVVKETYFYRHPEQWEAVTRHLAVAPPAGPLSAWSAGCATGEEAYTAAMVLHDAGERAGPAWVLGTDVSQRSLQVARAGTYGEWSLRTVPEGLRARHFTAGPGGLRVRGERRAAVRFAHHNLLGPPPPGGPFDLVICRNVLLYFKPATARAVLGRLFGALRPGGLLLVGPLEEPMAAGLALERLEGVGATVLRRLGAGGGAGRRAVAS